MRRACLHLTLLIGPSLAAPALSFSESMPFRDGLPALDHVFVNGHGPYRFLVDTGTNVNLIDTTLARSLDLKPTFRTELMSSSSSGNVAGGDVCVIRAGAVEADRQTFLISNLQTIRERWPGIQGVLGQAFLSGFDYLIRVKSGSVDFGAAPPVGTRTRFKEVNGRMAIAANLGNLVLDSGTDHLILFGIAPDKSTRRDLRTLTGVLPVGLVWRSLVISDQRFWSGDAIAIPDRSEAGVNGLLPMTLFRTIYVCNSQRYVVFESAISSKEKQKE